MALVADGTAQGESPRNENKMMSPEKLARRIVKGIKNNKRYLASSYEGKYTPILSIFFPRLVDKIYYAIMKREPDTPLD
jgi:short-subunit dehydrogenase